MNRTAAVYLRVSTDEQTVENQRAPLVAACTARGWSPVFFEEVESGAKRSRPQLDAMMAAAHRGEVQAVVVAALDRLGRSLLGVLETVQTLDKLSCPVVSLREPWLSIDGPHRTLLVSIFAWVAEQERAVIIERTKAGQRRARREGKHMGRPRRDSEALRNAIALASRGASLGDAARQFKVPLRTLKRRLEAAAKVSPEIPPAADVPSVG